MTASIVLGGIRRIIDGGGGVRESNLLRPLLIRATQAFDLNHASLSMNQNFQVAILLRSSKTTSLLFIPTNGLHFNVVCSLKHGKLRWSVPCLRIALQLFFILLPRELSPIIPESPRGPAAAAAFRLRSSSSYRAVHACSGG